MSKEEEKKIDQMAREQLEAEVKDGSRESFDGYDVADRFRQICKSFGLQY